MRLPLGEALLKLRGPRPSKSLLERCACQPFTRYTALMLAFLCSLSEVLGQIVPTAR
jgi:hypothetical protein